ncbi:DUF1918 domain-containing protein [Nitriliruptor alkaliphilus]|uniref:DUF1918 domain-containing protein n=1 Tax=Nitriliruptor alkaliphilus TaxID=427918 RepID=UPI0009FB5CF2|nr:DUF1918 domain-containing protein [Nitriliruptor alkaliphilus]
MKAQVGDRLVIKGHRVGEPDRDAEIIDVRGPDGEPPYAVRWSDSGRETLIYPGVDGRIEHLDHEAADPAVAVLGGPARDVTGAPALTKDRAIELVRRHAALETLRSSAYDDELWDLWVEEARRASPNGHNAAVLDRVLDRLRTGA